MVRRGELTRSALWAQALGGVLSSATLPGATAYIADVTTEGERSRGVAWMGAATSLGMVAGSSFSLGFSRTTQSPYRQWRRLASLSAAAYYEEKTET